MKQNIIDPNFVAEVQSGKHVFGVPDAYIKEKIKSLEKEIEKSESVKEGEFFMQNKELRAELSTLKAKKMALQSAGDYFLSLINKCDAEPWKNAILFCNIAFNYNPPEENENKDNIFESNTTSTFINKSELSSLMGKSYDEDDFEEGEEVVYDFAFQTKYGTFLINISTAKTSEKLPLFIMDNVVSTPNGPLFDLSSKDENFIYEHTLIDLIYNKTGAIILKNENWQNASSFVMHVKDMKSFIEESLKNKPMPNIERYKHLDFLYKHFVHKKESEFSKNVNRNLKNGGI